MITIDVICLFSGWWLDVKIFMEEKTSHKQTQPWFLVCTRSSFYYLYSDALNLLSIIHAYVMDNKIKCSPVVSTFGDIDGDLRGCLLVFKFLT